MTRRWMGPARGPVAVLVGPGPWDAFGTGLARLGYRSLDLGGEVPEAALSAEGLAGNLTLVGQGPGAIPAAELAARRPEALARLVLLEPHGIVAPPEPAAAARLRRLPVIGERLARRATPPVRFTEPEHRAIGRAGLPVVALWGGRAAAAPIAGLGVLARWNRQAKQEVVEGAGDDLLASHGDQVLDALAGVLREDYAG